MSRWRRVSQREPCEICGRPDWCGRSGSVVRCMRKSAPPTGWYIVKRCLDGGGVFDLLDTIPRNHRSTWSADRPRLKQLDWESLAGQFTRDLRSNVLASFARMFGVRESVLLDLCVGWDGRALTFPMKDASGAAIGFRRRFLDGRKRAIKGSRNGLFMPAAGPNEGLLFIAEGESDTAALLDLGVAAVGRPGCRHCVDHCLDLAQGRDIAIVADNDCPGREGAESLREALLTKAGSVKIIRPRPSFKDIREEARAGLTLTELLGRAARTPCHRPPRVVSPPLSRRHRWYAPERTRRI